ncbi:RNA polymerase sigma factor [Virgisporangium aliadipatigenens]|uniref:RNA polymerase sigma factor n=1 Tax=Virgisporangium aliadipatigenens TaxID=741659 RepID=A0A8J4DTS8_9ACTN|nr:RNA polymerase subunit sigma-70 [Virgisporangium aliadipatigenens]GIJ49333.1 RNA polymerase sigma factor [Virgisporangium aliadipatigenens]
MDDFTALAAPLRPEILAHCYRMLGSAGDAEDATQETYLRAWRGFGRFAGRSSLRVWLHRIATNACLRAIEQRGRRALPSGLGAPERDWRHPLRADTRTLWLEPLPTPADTAFAKASIRLAFVAALQHLPARQRAVLLLRDVVGLPAGEVAEALEMSTVAVNSALLRARDRLARAAPVADDLAEPSAVRPLVDRYVRAFEDADVGALREVLREDVTLEMPPFPAWFAGRAAVTGFLGAWVLDPPSRFRSWGGTPEANGCPTVVTYLRRPDATLHAHAIQVLEVTPSGIRHVHVFLSPELFGTFGLKPVTTEGGADLYR